MWGEWWGYSCSEKRYLTNITKWTNNKTTSHAGIYSIPCKDSNKHYISETQCNLEKRIYEHKWSIKANDNQNALFFHMLELKHTFDFSQATLIRPIHYKTSRRLLESAVISKTNHKNNIQVFTKSYHTWRTSYWTKTKSK